ncbi:12905_t:CDS:2 [Ambispora gerdemannii]|uniref:12905_t:CDS:1 n=1 Tax=Ambispora gerdemannii TaxID=144530 RepID=A0A9N9F7A6_9GLOM|nr:12905_t:CDS:2 [Ambispora gerdemannii]
MSRRKQSSSPGVINRDRHFQRSGLNDPRGNPKKGGAGGHNWGVITDSSDAREHDKFPNVDNEQGKGYQKIQVVNPEKFEVLQHAVAEEQ